MAKSQTWLIVTLGSFALLILLVIGVFFIRAEFYFPYPKDQVTNHESYQQIKGEEIVERFSGALRFKTVSTSAHVYAREEMLKFAAYLKQSFPNIYSSPLVSFETVNNYSLLFHVQGSDSSLAPYLLCSHLDVVPAHADKWEVDPFGGVVKDGFVYGRGATDVKNSLMAIMESLNYLITNKFEFQRSLWIAFGHDEEINGFDGARHIAETFRKKGITHFEYLLDEGMMIFSSSLVPGVNDYVAIIGVSEKGYSTIELNATAYSGHSSKPPEETAITILGRAVSKLTASCQPSLFGKGPEWDMFESLASYASYPYKLVYSNLWFFKPFVVKSLSEDPTLNPLVRTTTAVTMINGGIKENVLPDEAIATVNHRIHPAQTIEDMLEVDKRLVNDDRVTFNVKVGTPAAPISPHGPDAFGYQIIKKCINQQFNGTAVVPGLMLASTDTKWYLQFTKSVYRFTPLIIDNVSEDSRFHGHNERISVQNYFQIVNFFHQLMIKSNDKDLKA